MPPRFNRRSPGPPEDSDQLSSSVKPNSPSRPSRCARLSAATRSRSNSRAAKIIQAAPNSIVSASGALTAKGIAAATTKAAHSTIVHPRPLPATGARSRRITRAASRTIPADRRHPTVWSADTARSMAVINARSSGQRVTSSGGSRSRSVGRPSGDQQSAASTSIGGQASPSRVHRMRICVGLAETPSKR